MSAGYRRLCVQRRLPVDDSVCSKQCQPGKQRAHYPLVCLLSVNLISNSDRLCCASRIHGGSFTSGSATAPGLDGSNLAAATNSIVAVVQYRLGVVGQYGIVLFLLADICRLARSFCAQRTAELGCKGHHHFAELPPEGTPQLWRHPEQDHSCGAELGCQYDPRHARHSFCVVTLSVCYSPVGSNGQFYTALYDTRANCRDRITASSLPPPTRRCRPTSTANYLRWAAHLQTPTA